MSLSSFPVTPAQAGVQGHKELSSVLAPLDAHQRKPNSFPYIPRRRG